MPTTIELLKWSNLISSIMLILIGVTQIISLSILFSSISFTFFMSFFLPFFLILFGIMLFASGQKMEFMDNNFRFLSSLLGRGLFNIYLASLAVYQLANAASDIIGFIIGAMLFCTGGFYLILHFCGNKEELTSYKQQLG
ncbi:unnamed protein product [Paramecium octaurelia]|uniref:COPI associated protein n=1 Tax=Paramecium octaurelia TaxID=43137 RepID=A0A8S1VRG7_PAROT|nr:unnamed protein product [Paramecium octaurelia]